MYDEQQSIAGEKIGQDRIFALAANDLVHGVADSLNALERANLADDGRLIDADVNLSATQHAAHLEETESGECPHGNTDGNQRQQDPGKNAGQQANRT